MEVKNKLRIERTCERCQVKAVGQEEIDSAFQNKSAKTSSLKQYDKWCYFCRQDKRLVFQRNHPFLYKARNTIASHLRDHFKEWVEKGWMKHKYELQTIYGWTENAIAMLFEQGLNRGWCLTCEYGYVEMKNHEKEITLDIIDREKRPWFNGNIRDTCRSCNNAKQKMDLDKFNLRNAFGKRRKARLEAKPLPKEGELFKK